MADEVRPGSLPAAAAFDRQALREIVSGAIDTFAGGKVTDRVTEAVWPLLEHAQDAAAGSHEGIRLWMADCGELVAKHRARAEAAEQKLAPAAPTPAQCERLRQMAAEWGDAVSAVRRALDLAAPLDDDDGEIIAAGRAGLKVLSGEEGTGNGC